MKISVVIPAYNAAACITSAIQSCMQQTMQPHEIIVIDDASTDNTCDVLTRYKDVRLLKQATNQGPSAARNRGIAEATGDVIAFLDSDDTWLPEKLAAVYDIFSKHDEVVYLGHPYMLSAEQKSARTNNLSTLSYTSVLLKNPYQPSCLAIRKGMPLRFDESYRYCEDHELSIRVAYQYKVHWLADAYTVLGRPQLSTGGASANIWKMRKGELRLYSSIYKQNILFLPLIPFLWIFNIGKMIRRLILK
jgi:glycosyltransferase involved in cell wall biosynthesis